ncbi:4-hydroxy-3-methylbut-2-enyl diphosphate reductase [Streptomyces sp. MNP-20]|uniref:4-hydroxy-3-methylbut-2-enyl diphosphate reductase n=1 Tax=Streptomyces sp. MNP-20 TaxID=2721165 RepID=UPI002814B150|nr:4-hydroxy-3-methylbut-2-enyl diphosphate reductase [Streptomyces sp. MNP-20]
MTVATRLLLPHGAEVPCPAAPLLAGTLRRRGHTVARGPLALRGPGAPEAEAWWGIWPDRGEPVAALAAAAPVTAGARVKGDVRETVAAWTEAVAARTLVLAAPRSFCAGVERAIDTVERLLEAQAGTGRPVYVRKQIVHNTHVVEDLSARGAVFVEELDQVPDGATVVFSAHGVSPRVRAEAQQRRLTVVDATCPLVTKVHTEARRFAARGDTVVLIGHAGHEEIEGTLGEAPEAAVLVQDLADVAALRVPDEQHISYLTQTTLALEETQEIIAALRQRFPQLRGPGSADICYATTNRQQAVEAVAARSDVLLVVGSPNSSNSLRMVEVARRTRHPAYLVEDAAAIHPAWLASTAVVGLSAGASASPALVDEVATVLAGLGPLAVTEHTATIEHIRFAPPPAVRPR